MAEEIRSYFTTTASTLDEQIKDIVTNAIVETVREFFSGALFVLDWMMMQPIMIAKLCNTVRGAYFVRLC